jgi:hypothetical protein
MIMDPDRINILIVIKQPPWLSKHDGLFLVIERLCIKNRKNSSIIRTLFKILGINLV